MSKSVNSRFISIKQVLLPLLAHPRVAFLLKWFVYVWLCINFLQYVLDDILAYNSSLAADASLADIILTFRTTIDTAAWLVLIVVFELETYALPDAAFTRWLDRIFIAIKGLCYTCIAYAAYGYFADTLELYDLIALGHIDDLCSLAGQGLFLQLDAADYSEISLSSCSALHAGSEFFQIRGQTSIVSASELGSIRTMGWLDFGNAIVWIVVVILIDVEVHLQNTDQFDSKRLAYARLFKMLGYGFLIGACLMWFFYGYALYTWDAFLWIFGFWAIELNLAEWEQERVKELSVAP
ncbi:MAG: hypothetical protein HN526_00900 [Gammaproteobacteria bacterium]|jgi:hypothetical protein|nr:hypothetical protein [Gammaproteobacteria bacterium]MBT6948987.1 hypothetical protein [Gammaproteobacteria bacterium]